MKLMQKTGQSMPDRGSQEGHLPCDAGLKVSPPWLLKLNYTLVLTVFIAAEHMDTQSAGYSQLIPAFCFLSSIRLSANSRRPVVSPC